MEATGAGTSSEDYWKTPKNPLNIPEPRPLPGRPLPVPFVAVGDVAFALTTYVLKPYPESSLTTEKRIYNYRLRRTR